MNTHLVPGELVKKISERVDYHFRRLSEIPRGSGNENGIADFLEGFAKSLASKGVTYTRITDRSIGSKKIHDIVIRRPGTEACKDLPIVILQAHMDMVCQKIPESKHDFLTQGIELEVDETGTLMTSKRHKEAKVPETTLGADDGIGVACMMAILESDEISHPPIEALFTSDEEEDMTGAMAVSRELLQGNRLINIDTEKEGTFYCGCAGGINANFLLNIESVMPPAALTYYSLKISGLMGGHSGIEIDKKRANANRLLGRALDQLSAVLTQAGSALHLVVVHGGDKKNAITKEAMAIVGLAPAQAPLFKQEVENLKNMFINEYKYVEHDLDLTATEVRRLCPRVFTPESFRKLLSILLLIPNDVIAMYGDQSGLVETSCNLGVLQQTDSQIQLVSFIRSFIESKKQLVVKEMKILAELVGAEFSTDADFPNWEPNPVSNLKTRFRKAYLDTFEIEPVFESIHAGLECGHFARAFPDMDMIACGPTIEGAHTTWETLHLDTVNKTTRLLLNVLLQMPDEITESDLPKEVSGCDHGPQEHICQCIR